MALRPPSELPEYVVHPGKTSISKCKAQKDTTHGLTAQGVLSTLVACLFLHFDLSLRMQVHWLMFLYKWINADRQMDRQTNRQSDTNNINNYLFPAECLPSERAKLLITEFCNALKVMISRVPGAGVLLGFPSFYLKCSRGHKGPSRLPPLFRASISLPTTPHKGKLSALCPSSSHNISCSHIPVVIPSGSLLCV